MFTVNFYILIGIYLPVSAVSSCTTLLCFFLRLVAWNKQQFQWTIYHLRLPKTQLEVCKFLCDVWQNTVLTAEMFVLLLAFLSLKTEKLTLP